MKRVGEVVRVAQGLAVARSDSEEHPDIGTEAVDESLNAVGRVVDVFGPVSRPYVAVTTDDDPALLLGQTLYAR
ncbi:H/ACA ribonucleoprotein complex subunit GAR1 [Haloarchaeobius iranensis]|uniref:snoRNP protein GAR1 n=1 Tax=Haloarchaeobius iranensis TaxID=996166 RepID=A0A1G9TQJ4_9EURY|nr:Gar1/Naf1 family protein [Haloarchaeobius iranensis]SDM49953.1 snoRNP protein GAR1 [Haloarchaeobius iranensis]